MSDDSVVRNFLVNKVMYKLDEVYTCIKIYQLYMNYLLHKNCVFIHNYPGEKWSSHGPLQSFEDKEGHEWTCYTSNLLFYVHKTICIKTCGSLKVGYINDELLLITMRLMLLFYNKNIFILPKMYHTHVIDNSFCLNKFTSNTKNISKE